MQPTDRTTDDPGTIEGMAVRRLGGTAEGPRDKVIPLRLRADELDAIKAMAAEDGWEPSSWLYLRVQESLAVEQRKRRRKGSDQ